MDQELRQLARAAGTGEAPAQVALLRRAARAGVLAPERLELAAQLLGLAGLEAIGAASRAELPAVRSATGVQTRPRASVGRGEYGEELRLGVSAGLRGLDSPARSALLRLSGPPPGEAPQLPDVLLEVRLLGVRRLAIDLTGLHHVGSTAWAQLIGCADELQGRGGRTVLIMNPRQRVVWEMLGLEVFCAAAPDEVSARAALIDVARPDAAEALSPGEELEELSRFGIEACVRAASAIARAAPDLTESARTALGQAEAWARCPCQAHAARVEVARTGLLRTPPPWAAAPRSSGRWAWRAAACVVGGTWPERLQAGPAELQHARRALVPWALGLADPLRA